MLDPKILRENPDKIRQMLKDRAVEFDLDGLLDADKKRREYIIKTDELRKKKNQVSLEIAKKKNTIDKFMNFLWPICHRLLSLNIRSFFLFFQFINFHYYIKIYFITLGGH